MTLNYMLQYFRCFQCLVKIWLGYVQVPPQVKTLSTFYDKGGETWGQVVQRGGR